MTNKYKREKDLPRLINIWPKDLGDFSIDGTQKVIRALEDALGQERLKGRENHWPYNKFRHIGLLEALNAEQERINIQHAA